MQKSIIKHQPEGSAVSPISPRLISRKEAASYLGISLRFLCDLLASRNLASIRFGGRVLFDVSDLDAFIDNHRNKAQGWKGGAK
jgi:excisionase family DNA binding protein